MWFDGVRQPNTLYVASTSRGKDSTAMLRAIELLGFPLDAIVSVDIWFDENTPAELPPMVAFKDEYDRKVLERFGVPVTRVCARKRERERGARTATCSSLDTDEAGADTTEESTDSQTQTAGGANGLNTEKLTYVEVFYRPLKGNKAKGDKYGFPIVRANWCTETLKESALTKQNLIREIYGFPYASFRGGWCHKLKTGFLSRPRTRGRK